LIANHGSLFRAIRGPKRENIGPKIKNKARLKKVKVFSMVVYFHHRR